LQATQPRDFFADGVASWVVLRCSERFGSWNQAAELQVRGGCNPQ